MILITSAAYINGEFRSEFGMLPPAFLPVGNKRLYTYQKESLATTDPVILTVPEGFELPEHDAEQLKSLNVEVLAIPEGLSLGESIVCALNLMGYSRGPLKILHGDTLIYDLPLDQTDLISISEVEDNYEWATFDGSLLKPFEEDESGVIAEPDIQSVVTGYFCFSDVRLLIQSITRARGKFIDGVNLYTAKQAIRPIICKRWYDFGHLHTYYRSKTHISTARAFNTLSIRNGVVSKCSDMKQKMAAESNWFAQIPGNLRKYTPSFLGHIERDGKTGYELEYECISSLNELYVFGALPGFVWKKIIQSCFHFLESCDVHSEPASFHVDPVEFFGKKTDERLLSFSEESDIDLDESWILNGQTVPSLRDIHNRSLKYLPSSHPPKISHGDFCFSNILYDFRAQTVRVIDPRGIDVSGKLTIYGSPIYDVAKLAHSIMGKYDFIISGYFKLATNKQEIEFEVLETKIYPYVRRLFVQTCVTKLGLTEKQLIAMQIQLFLSMLPLHSDIKERQVALMANAMMLYKQLEGLS